PPEGRELRALDTDGPLVAGPAHPHGEPADEEEHRARDPRAQAARRARRQRLRDPRARSVTRAALVAALVLLALPGVAHALEGFTFGGRAEVAALEYLNNRGQGLNDDNVIFEAEPAASYRITDRWPLRLREPLALEA